MAIHRENWNCLDKMSFNGEMGIEGTLISLQKIYQAFRTKYTNPFKIQETTFRTLLSGDDGRLK